MAVKRIKSDFQFYQQAQVFNQVAQAKGDIVVVGERALVSCEIGMTRCIGIQAVML